MEFSFYTKNYEPKEIIDFALTLGKKAGELKSNDKIVGIIIDIEIEEDIKEREEDDKKEKELQEFVDDVHNTLVDTVGRQNIGSDGIKINMLKFKTERFFQIASIKQEENTFVGFDKQEKLSNKDFNNLKNIIISKFELKNIN